MSINLGENKLSDVIKMDTGTGGSNDYNDLNNKPQINGITLEGNKTSAELGIVTGPTDVYTKQETNTLVDTKIAEAGATKADTSYVNEQLNLKADKSAVDLALASKANVDDIYTKDETVSAINSAIANKADTSYVNEQLNLKADKATTYTKEEVNTAISDLEASVNTKLNTKVDKTDTYTKSETVQAIKDNTTNKADTSYVNEQLALKADKADTYTKEEIDEKLDNPTITGDTLPVGSVVEWTGTQTPQNWLLCDGREVSRTTYSELFAAIGTVWGAGDGSTSFNLPDFTDKFTLGAGGDVDLAETGGEKEVTLTVDHIPPHNHRVTSYKGDGSTNDGYNARMGNGIWENNIYTTAIGGGQPHNNMPPYVGSYYIIKAKQSAGVVATVVDNLSSTSPTDALSANQGKILNDKFKPVVLYETDKTVSAVADNTVISLNDNLSNYKRIVLYGISNNNNLGSVEVYNPTINDQPGMFIASNGSRSGMYAFNGTFRQWLITSENKITYRDATDISSKIVSSSALTGFVNDSTNIKIYKIIGFKY